MQTTEIELHADQMGISCNTFKAAKKELGITSVRLDDVWWWKLPSKPMSRSLVGSIPAMRGAQSHVIVPGAFLSSLGHLQNIVPD